MKILAGDRDPRHRTQIVVTLGPACETESRLKRLIALGVDIFRVNGSHGRSTEHARRIQRVRRIARRLQKIVQVLVDLPGPKFRLGSIPGGSMELKAGETVRLTDSRTHHFKTPCLPLRQADLLARLKPGHSLFVNDGTVELRMLCALKGIAICRVISGGVVRSGSGINLRHTDLDVTLPIATDLPWIRFAAAHHAEWLAVSFVQTAEDVERVRKEANKSGYRPQIMAKIEKCKALDNLKAIIQVSDGVMVARGDLGVETPLEEIPFVQKRIIAVANRQKKFVVTATQMLESMVVQPTPTRAEVSDIANAVIDGTDGVMLSAESAIGRYPVEAASVLARVLSAAERALPSGRQAFGNLPNPACVK